MCIKSLPAFRYQDVLWVNGHCTVNPDVTESVRVGEGPPPVPPFPLVPGGGVWVETVAGRFEFLTEAGLETKMGEPR